MESMNRVCHAEQICRLPLVIVVFTGASEPPDSAINRGKGVLNCGHAVVRGAVSISHHIAPVQFDA